MNTSSSIEVNEFTIHHPEGEDSVAYRQGDEDFHQWGMDEGKLLIRLGIDGLWTIVSADRGQTAALTLIERGIAALTEVRIQLERMAPEEARNGRCLAMGDWGRCCDREGHTGEHQFPDEREWRSLNNVPTAVEA